MNDAAPGFGSASARATKLNAGYSGASSRQPNSRAKSTDTRA